MVDDKIFKQMAGAMRASHKSRVQNPMAFKLKMEKGIDLKKEKNKSMASSKAKARYNAAGSKLKIINDAKAEIARKLRMSNPQHASMVDSVVRKSIEELDKNGVNPSSSSPVSSYKVRVTEPRKQQQQLAAQRPWYSTHNAIHNAGSNKGYGSPTYHSAATPTDGRSMSSNNFGKKKKTPEYY
tara:strand:- start:6046 stop:6594 length:549 start_codon:yes stop_codon:yes gene_type:complete